MIKGKTTSTIIPDAEHVTDEMVMCSAYERDGKCGTCRDCWDKSKSVIAYPAHGKKMIKLINTISIEV